MSVIEFSCLQPYLPYLWQNFQLEGSWYENQSFLVWILQESDWFGIQIFCQILDFDYLQPFTYLRQKIPAWSSCHENCPFSSGLSKSQIDLGIQRFGQMLFFFCNNIPTHEKICWPEVYPMKTGLFSRHLSLQAIETRENLTVCSIILMGELTKTFCLIKILRKITWKDLLKVPGLLLHCSCFERDVKIHKNLMKISSTYDIVVYQHLPPLAPVHGSCKYFTCILC